MPPSHRRLTQEFQDEAVQAGLRPAAGTRREVAEDLGDRLYRPCATGSIAAASARSTIRLRSARRTVAAALKRLRRENEILRQERDILKRATAFFAKEGSR